MINQGVRNTDMKNIGSEDSTEDRGKAEHNNDTPVLYEIITKRDM